MGALVDSGLVEARSQPQEHEAPMAQQGLLAPLASQPEQSAPPPAPPKPAIPPSTEPAQPAPVAASLAHSEMSQLEQPTQSEKLVAQASDSGSSLGCLSDVAIDDDDTLLDPGALDMELREHIVSGDADAVLEDGEVSLAGGGGSGTAQG